MAAVSPTLVVVKYIQSKVNTTAVEPQTVKNDYQTQEIYYAKLSVGHD